MGLLSKLGSYAKAATGLPALNQLAHGNITGAAKASLGGQILNDVGVDLSPEVKDPDANEYLAGTKENAQEAMRRAYEMADKNAVRDPNQIAAGHVTAAQTGGPIGDEAHTAGVTEATADKVGAPQTVVSPWLPDAAKVAAAKAGAIREAGGATVGPADLQRSTAVQKVDTTSTGEALLRQAAEGGAPSQAEALLNQGLDKTAQKQLSLAASAKGSERRGARRAALMAIGSQGADAAQAAAAQRASEMATARSSLASTEQNRQQIEQGANSLQAQIDAAAARGDADAVNRLKAQQADLTAQASQVNASAQNTRTDRDTDRQTAADAANAAAQNARDSERAGYVYKAEDTNAARDLQAREGDAQRGTSVSLANAAAKTSSAESLARRQDETDQQYADRVQKWSEANAARDMDAQKTNVGNDLGAQGANVTNTMRADESNATTKLNALTGARAAAAPITQVELAKLGQAQAAANIAKEQANALNQTILKAGAAYATGGASLAAPGGSPLGGGAAPGPDDPLPLGYTSDKRLKTDIKKIGAKDATRLADAYQHMVSTYKFKGGDDKTTAGVMAQELRKDPLGAKFVHSDDDGKLSVDYNGLHTSVIAGLAAKLEARAQRTAKGRRP